MPDCAVVALNVGVLLRFSGLDVLDGNTLFLSPFQQLATDIFGAIINPNSFWFSSPFDDPIEAANNPFGWQRKIDLDAETLAVKSSSTFKSRNARPSIARQAIAKQSCREGPRRSAMKSIDQVTFGASGTASASGLSRFNRLRGLMRKFSSNSQ